jgi:hypothetical protein
MARSSVSKPRLPEGPGQFTQLAGKPRRGSIFAMLKLCLRSASLGLFVTLSLIADSGCSGESLVSPDGGKKTSPPDGSVADVIPGDPAACGCHVDSGTLTISWECYCKQYDCTVPQPFADRCSGSSTLWTHGCGFYELSVQTIGGLERWVYTNAGQLIGAQLGTDTADFTCPTDRSLHGYVLRAGQFPLQNCEAQAPCPCVDGGASCRTPFSPDGGTPPLPPAGAAI